MDAGDELAAFEIKELEGLGEGERERKASGAFGAVYEVTLNGMPCIAKRLHEVLVNQNVNERDREAMNRKFRIECVLLSRLRHPNVVQFLGVHYDRDDSDLTLVMEYLHMDLEKCIRQYQNMPLSITISILLDVSYGLMYLHAQDPPIIHRDLTAGNILLTPDMRAKLADLGVSKILDVDPSRLLGLTACPGTFAYMPPEALKPHPVYDVKLDNFSFGVLSLYAANQEFPMVYHETELTETAMKEGTVQILKRQLAIDKLGSDHCLFGLITQCLLDDSKKRPSTAEINKMLKHLSRQYSKHFHDVMEMYGELGKLSEEQRQLRQQYSGVNSAVAGEEKVVVLTEHVKQYQMLVEKCQDELDARREQEVVNKELMNYLAKTTEEYNQKAFHAQQEVKRVETEKEALVEELRRVRDRNVMAMRLQQEVERREEVEGKLVEVQREKHELQKQKEEAERMRDKMEEMLRVKLEQGEQERGKEVGVWRAKADDLEEQVRRLTDELKMMRHENKRIKDELDLKEVQAQIYEKDFHAERHDREHLASRIEQERVKYEQERHQLKEELDRSYHELELAKQISMDEKEELHSKLEDSLHQLDEVVGREKRLQTEVEIKSQQMKVREMDMEHYQNELRHFQSKARFYKESEQALDALRKERECLLTELRRLESERLDQQDLPTESQSLPPPPPPPHRYENVTPKLSREDWVDETGAANSGSNNSSSSPMNGNSLTTDGDGDDDAVFDPNLTCLGCMRRFRHGEIQRYRRHVHSCEAFIQTRRATSTGSNERGSRDESDGDSETPLDPT